MTAPQRLNGATITHKFAQKYGFKGSWDATGKLVKQAIMRNEKKYERCENALECYKKLRLDLTKKGDDDKNKKWKQWEENNDSLLLKKTALTTNRTYIGLGVESKDELKKLQQEGFDHIVHTDRTSIPDMKALKETQKLNQVQSHGDDQLLCAILPCSCPPCRKNPQDFGKCLYANERKIRIETRSVKKSTTNDETNTDIFAGLTVVELRQRCKTYNLPSTGNKQYLLDSLLNFDEKADEFFDTMNQD
jgi:hypothetical protein